MKQVQPLLKHQGRNISIPFFVNLHLSNKFDGRNGFSKYILKLILSDLVNDEIFVNDFRNELRQMKQELIEMGIDTDKIF